MNVFHAAEELNRLALADKELHHCLEVDALFWNIHRDSVQTALFIILGRLFDTGRTALSIGKFLDETIEHPGHFSKEALANRKMAGGPKPYWLDDRMAEAWVPDRAALTKLREALKPHEERIRTYQEIRHKHYAHRPLNEESSVWGLFQKTNRSELSETIAFLHNLKTAIWQLYYNGKEPDPDERWHEGGAETVKKSVRSVLQKLNKAHEEVPVLSDCKGSPELESASPFLLPNDTDDATRNGF